MAAQRRSISRMTPIKLVHVMTVPQSLYFLGGQIGYLQRRGFQIHAVASPAPHLAAFGKQEDVQVHALDMPRRITPIRDLLTLWKLWRLLRRLRPHIVHAHTPKGGLLGTLAAWLARVPVRVYHMRGLPVMTATGLKRILLTWSERVSCALAHRILCVSPSVRDVAVDAALCKAHKITVLGSGGNGIDATDKFDPTYERAERRSRIRTQHAIPEGATVLGFVGRIVRDKGVVELVEAWQQLRAQFPRLHLLVVGPFESQDPVPQQTVHDLHSDERIHLTGPVDDIAAYYAAMDVVALPTYREGLPNVPLEAAAMTLPVVATRVPGCVDAVEDGVTGTLVPPADSDALAEAVAGYLADEALRSKHGAAGRERVLRDFKPETIWKATFREYVRLLQSRNQPLPSSETHQAQQEPSAVCVAR